MRTISLYVYYESRNRELQTRPFMSETFYYYESIKQELKCRCNERLKTKDRDEKICCCFIMNQ